MNNRKPDPASGACGMQVEAVNPRDEAQQAGAISHLGVQTRKPAVRRASPRDGA